MKGKKTKLACVAGVTERREELDAIVGRKEEFPSLLLLLLFTLARLKKANDI